MPVAEEAQSNGEEFPSAPYNDFFVKVYSCRYPISPFSSPEWLHWTQGQLSITDSLARNINSSLKLARGSKLYWRKIGLLFRYFCPLKLNFVDCHFGIRKSVELPSKMLFRLLKLVCGLKFYGRNTFWHFLVFCPLKSDFIFLQFNLTLWAVAVEQLLRIEVLNLRLCNYC